MPLNPKPFLHGLIGQQTVVRLKWGDTEYRGRLASVDTYMNLQLDEADEYVGGEHSGKLGDVFIRCNNVLWVGPAPDAAAATA